MSRPLQYLSDQVLREQRARTSAALESFDEVIHYFGVHLELHDSSYVSRLPPKVRDMIEHRDYTKMLREASEVARQKLADELDEVLTEIEERELDALDAKDGSGGIAA